jgi:hypothetical protein
MIIYIKDTTVNPIQEMTFDNYNSAVQYLGDVSKRAYGQSRKDRMIHLESIGHGYDDPTGVNFVRSLAEHFEMGVIREGRRVRCDITAMLFNKEEFGN